MNVDMLLQATDSAGAAVLFGIIVLVSFALIILLILIGLLILRAVWRWLTRYSFNNVVVFVERKALRESDPARVKG
jgi:hypothetical protein